MSSTSTTLDSSSEINAGLISKMKVADLKKELKARGLSAVGTKNELVERLQAATSQDLLSEDGNAESEILDEDDVLGGEEEGGDFDDDDLVAEEELVEDEKEKPSDPASPPKAVKRPAPPVKETSQETQPKPKRVLIRPPSITSTGKENGSEEKEVKEVENGDNKVDNGKKVLKLTGISVKERLELRAQKFGVPPPISAKKEARAERFGISTSNTTSGKSSKISFNTVPNAELLQKRAQRFGMNVSKVAIKVEEKEKLKKRQERFGTVSTVSSSSSLSIAEKKKLRAEKFKI